jgi:hypothetical protein
MGKEISTYDFVTKVELKYPNKFTFEKTIYLSSKKEVILTCKEHGDFLRKPADILSSDNIHCVSCKKEEKMKNINLISEINVNNKFGFLIKLINYTSQGESVFKCETHGIFSQNYYTVLKSKYGCKYCAFENKNNDIKEDTKNNAFKFTKQYFETNNYFPVLSFLKKLSKSCHTYFHDNGIEKYNNMMSSITPDYHLFINAHYDFMNRRCGSVYELILNNILIKNKIEHIFQYSFDNTKRTSDYYFPNHNLIVEIAGRNDEEYTAKLISKREFYIQNGFNYIEINPTLSKSSYNLNYFLSETLLDLLNCLNVKNTINLNELLIGSNIINTMEKLINTFIGKHGIHDFYCRSIKKNDITLYNLITKTFTTVEDCCKYFNIDFIQTNGNKPRNYWSNPQSYADEINLYIKESGKNPTFTDLSCLTNLSYNGFSFDDFRPDGKYEHLIQFSKNDNHKKRVNGYWTLDKVCKYLVENSIDEKIPNRTRFKNEKLDGGCLGAIYNSFGGLNNFKPNGLHYSNLLKFTS